jgi:hypothetical protein
MVCAGSADSIAPDLDRKRDRQSLNHIGGYRGKWQRQCVAIALRVCFGNAIDVVPRSLANLSCVSPAEEKNAS